MAASIVGLEIGSSAVKGVKIVPRRKGLDLLNFARVSLPQGVVEKGRVTDEGVVASALEELINDLRPGRSTIISGISGEQAVIRTLKVPRMEDAELREALPWEAEQYMPFPIHEAALDFVVMGSAEGEGEEGEELIEVLVVAAPKDVVDSYLRPLRRVGLKPQQLDLQPYGLVHAHLYSNGDMGNVALVDIGAACTDIVIVTGREVELTRTITLGGNDFSKILAERMSISQEEGEQYKIRRLPSLYEEEPQLNENLISIVQELTGEITRSLDYFHIQHRGEKIEKVLLTGGGSQLAGLDDYLGENLDMAPEHWELLTAFNLPRNIDFKSLKQAEKTMVVSMGLAISEVMA